MFLHISRYRIFLHIFCILLHFHFAGFYICLAYICNFFVIFCIVFNFLGIWFSRYCIFLARIWGQMIYLPHLLSRRWWQIQVTLMIWCPGWGQSYTLPRLTLHPKNLFTCSVGEFDWTLPRRHLGQDKESDQTRSDPAWPRTLRNGPIHLAEGSLTSIICTNYCFSKNIKTICLLPFDIEKTSNIVVNNGWTLGGN